MENNKYLSLTQIVESSSYPFSIGQLRHFLLKRHKNGLDKAVRRIGKRIYLRQDLFDQWIEAQASRRGGL